MTHQPNRFAVTRRGTAAAVLLLAALALPVAPARAASTFEGHMLELVNGARANAGVPPVQAAPGLAAVAGDRPYLGCGYTVAGRSADMGARNYFSHTILNCGTQGASDMLRAAGLPNGAENIAWVSGITDPVVAAERLHNDLMTSPVHRDNLLNPAFTHLGVGSWHTATGQSWTGGGESLRNVYVTTEILSKLPVVGTTGGARYHPLTPSRILDTRSGAPLGPGVTMDLPVTGAGGVPASGVSAVILNVAVTGPTAVSYLTVFPSGEARPSTANLNYTAGQTVPNLVTAKLGAGGRLSVFNAAGATHVIADVAGWYDDGTIPGARYHPVSPSRILDTRTTAGPIGAAAVRNLQVTGQGGLPASGVSAVVMNVAVTAPTASSYLTVFPAGEAMPMASNLNFSVGETVPNLVTAKLGAGGQVSLYNAAGTTQVIADVAGWYDDGTAATGAGYHPLTPGRVLDTRNGASPIGQTALDMQVTGQGGVPDSGVSAVVMNVAVTGPTAISYLTVYPAGDVKPLAANLNYVPGQTVPNLVVAKLGAGGRASIANAVGTTHAIADVAGWFDAG